MNFNVGYIVLWAITILTCIYSLIGENSLFWILINFIIIGVGIVGILYYYRRYKCGFKD